MKFTILLAGLLAAVAKVQATSVFAHFMFINTKNYTLSDFEDDFKLAKNAHIDAFALNMGKTNPHTADALVDAFEAAANVGFQLFFSFDYNVGEDGSNPWPKEAILDMAAKYFHHDNYFKYAGKPVASTFEGPENAEDWVEIKSKTGCFFIPDWSSKSPEEALGLAGGVADGLFSWDAWPLGDESMNTEGDDAYKWALQGKPYMMPVSPWFYTNLPGYEKNWVWRGDDLWHDRWAQIIEKQPQFVQIISWNDYGESHHIGPLRDKSFEAFTVGKAPFNYALDHPHDGWRHFLPYLIDTYKGAIPADIKTEGLTTWYRTSPALACSDGGTTLNSESHPEAATFSVTKVIQDKIFFSALLTSHATIDVSVGGKWQSANWTTIPDGGKGVYHGSIPFTGSGDVVIKMYKYATEIASINGKAIVTECPGGLTNWNAWVGATDAKHVDDPNPTPTPTGENGPRVTASDDDDSAGTFLRPRKRGLFYALVVVAGMAIA